MPGQKTGRIDAKNGAVRMNGRTGETVAVRKVPLARTNANASRRRFAMVHAVIAVKAPIRTIKTRTRATVTKA
jgi:hypothetical protein